MHRMWTIGVQRSLVREFHHATQFIPEPARRDIRSDKCFEQPRYLPLQLAYLGGGILLLLLGYVRLPAKCENVYIHGKLRGNAEQDASAI